MTDLINPDAQGDVYAGIQGRLDVLNGRGHCDVVREGDTDPCPRPSADVVHEDQAGGEYVAEALRPWFRFRYQPTGDGFVSVWVCADGANCGSLVVREAEFAAFKAGTARLIFEEVGRRG